MKKNVWIFGLIIGVILCMNMIWMVNLFYTNPDFKGNEFAGYAVMVVVFSLIFFGVRNYRNKYLDGMISFGHALKTGVFIALVASAMYVIVWLFYYYLFVPDFLDKYMERVVSQSSPETLAAKTKEMAYFKEMYKNPLFVILLTLSEVLPVGLIVALISALFLKRKV